MKQFLIAGMFVLALTACRKERTCVCTQPQLNTTEANANPTETTTYKKITKIKAKRLCRKIGESYHASTYYNNGGTTITNFTDAYDCELK
jgi:hypothetical protein